MTTCCEKPQAVLPEPSAAATAPAARLAPQPSGGFLRNVAKLISGLAAAQGLSILVSPILTRLYSREVFGTTALFMAIALVWNVMATGRYHMALIPPKEDREAANVLVLSLLATALNTVLVTVGVWLLGPLVAGALRLPELGGLLWLLPPTVAARGAFQTFQYWAARQGRFGHVARAQFHQGLVGTTAVLAAGAGGWATATMMVLGRLVGLTGSAALLAGDALRRSRPALAGVSLRGIVAAARRYCKFPLVSSWGTVLHMASYMVSLGLMGWFFGPVVVALYALVERVMYTPLTLVANSIGQVFYQRASETRHANGDMGALTLGLFRRLLALGTLPLALTAVGGGHLFAFAFGPQWAEAGLYAQVLSIYALSRLLVEPLLNLCLVQGRQEIELVYCVAMLVTRIVAVLVGGLLMRPLLCMAILAAGTPLVAAGVLAWTLRAAGASPAAAGRALLARLLAVAPFAAAAGAVSHLAGGFWGLLAVLVAGAAGMAWTFWQDRGLRASLAGALRPAAAAEPAAAATADVCPEAEPC